MSESTPQSADYTRPAAKAGKEPVAQPLRKAKSLQPRTSGDLPPYTRSLLRIKVPVVVALVEKRQDLGSIIELAPGSIIRFDKSCKAMLGLEVGNQPIACGVAVKVGDQLGLRITAMVPRPEEFSRVTSDDMRKTA